jgi:hypothetical protein
MPARPQTAPDLGDECRGLREVLDDVDREHSSEGCVGEAKRLVDVVEVERRFNLVSSGSRLSDLDHAR